MDFFEVIKNRASVRDYLKKEVEMDKIGLILESARLAPSSGNLQSWYFVIVKDKNKREEIAKACYNQLWMINAPVHIVIVADVDKCKRFYGERGEKLYSIQNTAMAAENMLLTATYLNLGACFVSAFDDEKISEILGIPSGFKPHGIITIGYPKFIKRKEKASLYSLVFLETFGNRISNIDNVLLNFRVGDKIKKSILESSESFTERVKKLINKITKKES